MSSGWGGVGCGCGGLCSCCGHHCTDTHLPLHVEVGQESRKSRSRSGLKFKSRSCCGFGHMSAVIIRNTGQKSTKYQGQGPGQSLAELFR